jgi:hypothetical protein
MSDNWWGRIAKPVRDSQLKYITDAFLSSSPEKWHHGISKNYDSLPWKLITELVVAAEEVLDELDNEQS